jgi:hypothetical protein
VLPCLDKVDLRISFKRYSANGIGTGDRSVNHFVSVARVILSNHLRHRTRCIEHLPSRIVFESISRLWGSVR